MFVSKALQNFVTLNCFIISTQINRNYFVVPHIITFFPSLSCRASGRQEVPTFTLVENTIFSILSPSANSASFVLTSQERRRGVVGFGDILHIAHALKCRNLIKFSWRGRKKVRFRRNKLGDNTICVGS